MEARRAIEPMSARLAARHMTVALRDELSRTIEVLVETPTGPTFRDYRPYWEADELFHRLIAEHSGNPYLLSAHTTLRGHVQRFRQFGGSGITDSDQAIAEHGAILLALEGGHPAQAAKAMDRHLLNVKRRAVTESARGVPESAPAPRV
ncbi:GntR family transcriptional regulator [Naasia aerilata]|uniref:GntR C-terminal domain-containing protein n=1 Tax=Naasia aerilata TaxID=1162966 RepID=A0ABN6XI72_9MICO|nr:hypothetical protein GCM10025866_04580 [Naasia aerilata]